MILHIYKTTILSLLGALLLMGCQNSETELHAQTSQKKEKSTQAEQHNPAPPAKEQQAEVVLTEYSDFECPACAYFYPIVEKLKTTYGDKLEVDYHYFPLNIHQFAMLSARAAESARKQGKFEAMYDMLFKNQRQWASSGNPQPAFINYAKRIGLDIAQFKKDLNAAETQKAVIADKNTGIERGVNSTPTFYINGEEMVNLPRTYEAFKAQIDIYLKEAEKASSNS